MVYIYVILEHSMDKMYRFQVKGCSPWNSIYTIATQII